jgi:MHS family proline/betaine transporter-like MFS transporter
MQKRQHLSNFKTIFSGSIGNVLEWYDFAVYGYFAKILAPNFFPSDDKMVSLISVFGVFAAGFLMRPVGAVLFGHIGDKQGRKQALMLSVLLMAITTTCLGFLPTYATAGILAPVLLTLLRLLQGISVGGELTTSISFIVEIAPENKRGFYGSWTLFSATLGILLGSAVGALVDSMLTSEELAKWGWRIPFYVGFLVGSYGLYIRRGLKEPEVFQQLRKSGNVVKSPLIYSFRHYTREIILVAGALWIFSTGFYLTFVYLPTYLSTETHTILSVALDINTMSMVILLPLIVLMANLSDRFGRKPLMMAGTVGFILLSYPLFKFLSVESQLVILFVQVIFAIFQSTLQGAVPAFLVETFPTRVRVSAISFSYNIALGIFGGTTPLVATYLIKATNNIYSPAFYLIFCAIVSSICLFFLKESYKKKLE